jgi:hypothetical protein
MFPWCFFGLSLRLNAKSGIVAGLDAAGLGRIQDDP